MGMAMSNSDPSFDRGENCDICGVDATRCECPICDVCQVQGDKRCTDPGHCTMCGEFKVNTGPREETCGKDACLSRIYG